MVLLIKTPKDSAKWKVPKHYLTESSTGNLSAYEPVIILKEMVIKRLPWEKKKRGCWPTEKAAIIKTSANKASTKTSFESYVGPNLPTFELTKSRF